MVGFCPSLNKTVGASLVGAHAASTSPLGEDDDCQPVLGHALPVQFQSLHERRVLRQKAKRRSHLTCEFQSLHERRVLRRY